MQFNQGYTTAGGGAYAGAGTGQPAFAPSAYPPPSAYAPTPAYGGGFGAPATFGRASASRFDDEPPLLEGKDVSCRSEMSQSWVFGSTFADDSLWETRGSSELYTFNLRHVVHGSVSENQKGIINNHTRQGETHGR